MSDPLYEAGYRVIGYVPEPVVTAAVSAQMLLDEAMQTVEAHADEDWKRWAYKGGAALSAHYAVWCTDDLWEWMEQHVPSVTTHEPRALGPVIQRLKKDGKIAKDPVRYVQSERTANHCRPIPVYRSLVHS